MIPMLLRQPGFVSCQFFLLLVFLFVGVGVETHVENSNVVKTTRCFVKNLSRFGFFVSWCFLKKGLLGVVVQKQVVSASRFDFLVFLDNKTHVCLFVGFLSFPQA